MACSCSRKNLLGETLEELGTLLVVSLAEKNALTGLSTGDVVYDTTAGSISTYQSGGNWINYQQQLLAFKYYSVTGGGGVYTIDSSTYADIDNTNLSFDFTAPTSGNVMIKFSGCFTADSGTNIEMRIVNVSNTQVGLEGRLLQGATSVKTSLEVYVTGLTPGTTYTYHPQWRRTGSANPVYLSYNVTTGAPIGCAIIIEVMPR